MKERLVAKPVEIGPVPDTQSSEELPKQMPKAEVAHITDGRRLGESDRLFQRACQFHSRKGLDQAIALYQTVIKKNPQHAQARFNLVAAYLQAGSYTQAYPLAAGLYAEDPDNPQVLLNLAIAHMGCGRYRKALALLDKVATQPDAPVFETVFHKAVALSHLGRPKSALACYRQAETLRPADPRLLFNMAVAYDQQQQYSAAVAYYLKYLDQVREKDAPKIEQVRRRIRALQTYGAEEKVKERNRG